MAEQKTPQAKINKVIYELGKLDLGDARLDIEDWGPLRVMIYEPMPMEHYPRNRIVTDIRVWSSGGVTFRAYREDGYSQIKIDHHPISPLTWKAICLVGSLSAYETH